MIAVITGVFVVLAAVAGAPWIAELPWFPRPRPAPPSTPTTSTGLQVPIDLSGVTIRIGSKGFNEQYLLGHIAIQALRAAGAKAPDHQIGLGGTTEVRDALERSEIDAYFEYTGTAWIEIFGRNERIVDLTEQFRRVRDEDRASDGTGISWFALASANSSYAIAANEAAVNEHGVSNVSDYAKIANDDPDAAALCIPTEFRTRRSDGLPSLMQYYGFKLPEHQISRMDADRVYKAVGEGELCRFGVVFLNAGEITAQNLTPLTDDKGFFPPYNIAMAMRDEVYRPRSAEFVNLFRTISNKLTDDKMLELNTKVTVNHQDPAEVAKEFLQDEGIIPRAGD